MPDYFDRLVARARGDAPTVAPLVASRFEDGPRVQNRGSSLAERWAQETVWGVTPFEAARPQVTNDQNLSHSTPPIGSLRAAGPGSPDTRWTQAASSHPERTGAATAPSTLTETTRDAPTRNAFDGMAHPLDFLDSQTAAVTPRALSGRGTPRAAEGSGVAAGPGGPTSPPGPTADSALPSSPAVRRATDPLSSPPPWANVSPQPANVSPQPANEVLHTGAHPPNLLDAPLITSTAAAQAVAPAGDRRQPASWANAESAESASVDRVAAQQRKPAETVIRVSIGRIEIRGAPVKSTERPRQERPKPRLPLDAFLDRAARRRAR